MCTAHLFTAKEGSFTALPLMAQCKALTVRPAKDGIPY